MAMTNMHNKHWDSTRSFLTALMIPNWDTEKYTTFVTWSCYLLALLKQMSFMKSLAWCWLNISISLSPLNNNIMPCTLMYLCIFTASPLQTDRLYHLQLDFIYSMEIWKEVHIDCMLYKKYYTRQQNRWWQRNTHGVMIKAQAACKISRFH